MCVYISEKQKAENGKLHTPLGVCLSLCVSVCVYE